MLSTSLLARTMKLHPMATAIDIAVSTVVFVSALFLVWEYDLVEFRYEGASGPHITLEEGLALLMLLGLSTLAFVLRRAHEKSRDKERLLAVQAELTTYRRLASSDSLTSLPNRREFMVALEAALKPGQNEPHAVFLLDLNGFKQINDDFGHATGDAVLCAVAERFRTVARREDLVARLGGDEFGVLALNVPSRGEAADIGQRYLTALRNEVTLNGRLYSVGVAIGVAF